MRFAFIRDHRHRWPVTAMCRVLEVSASGFHAFMRRPPSAHDIEDEALRAKTRSIFESRRRVYGSPRIHAELKAKGDRHGRKRVARIMKEEGLCAKRTRRFKATTDSKHAFPIAPNVLDRNFQLSQPDRAWCGDVTAIWTNLGWRFLSTLIDLFSRRVVAWAISESNDTKLALSALQKALRSRNVGPGLVHHTDRGSPYASHDYRQATAAAGMITSMSRKGDCWDNAVAESFFATLRAELIDRHENIEAGDLQRLLAEYIDGFYNLERRHSTIGFQSPVEFETRCAAAAVGA